MCNICVKFYSFFNMFYNLVILSLQPKSCMYVCDGFPLFELNSAGYAGVWDRKEGNILFNDVLNTFYLRLYGVRHMVKDHSDSERGNPLPQHGLIFSINNKGSFICTIPQTG